MSDKNYIACRVCERVFLSTKALINHLDSHIMSEEDAARVRKHLEISHLMSAQHHQTPNLFWNPALIRPGLAATSTARPFYPSQQIQPYFNDTRQFYSPVQAPPVPYSDHFNVLPNPNSYRNPNPNPYPNTQALSSATRALNTGYGSRFGASSFVPSSPQATPRVPAMGDSRDSGFGALSLVPTSQQAALRMPEIDGSRDSGFVAFSLAPPSQQATPRMLATEDSRDFSRQFLALLEYYPIPKMNSNCNGNSSEELDLTLRL